MYLTFKKHFGLFLIVLTCLSAWHVGYTATTLGANHPVTAPINPIVFGAQQPSRFELYRSYQHAESIMKSPAFNSTPAIDSMRFSVAGSYLDNLHANLGVQSQDDFDNLLSSPLRNGKLEMFLENSRRTTLVLQILNNKNTPQAPVTIAALNNRKPGGFIWPILRGVISSPFGIRWGRMHKGVDIAAPFATPIYASAPGIVVNSGFISGYGLTIEIKQPGGQIVTRYAHCGYSNVRIGQQVNQGDYIGNIGLTGNTTGPHLHFEILVNNTQVDPLTFGI